jgi:hypothetical protein
MAAFNVSDFRSQMTGDGARPNLFACEINNLGIVSGSLTGGETGAAGVIAASPAQKFNFMCRAAQLPGSTVNQVPVNYFGRELKFAGNRTFTEWTVTIINDEDFILRDSFEKWMNRINRHVSNTRAPGLISPLEYQADGLVTQYGKRGDVIKRYNFKGMFPIDISPIELDWGANDTIEEYAVTFAYQWWEARTTDRP